MIATAVNPWLEPEDYQALGQECNCSLARRKYGEKYVSGATGATLLRYSENSRSSNQQAESCSMYLGTTLSGAIA
ncbi:hypothetical protein PHISP_02031 [Aspergillus sp. HF37]|nr:hypothetical protein PHISP_02031 [Aspergillus sp. HF37]